MARPTKEDWGRIRAKCFVEPDFHEFFTRDPTGAVKQWAKENGKDFSELVEPFVRPADLDDDYFRKVADGEEDDPQPPPACC